MVRYTRVLAIVFVALATLPGSAVAQLAQELDAVHARQVQVEQHEPALRGDLPRPEHLEGLEPVAGLNIALGYGLGHGTAIAPTWQRAA